MKLWEIFRENLKKWEYSTQKLNWKKREGSQNFLGAVAPIDPWLSTFVSVNFIPISKQYFALRKFREVISRYKV